MRKSSLTLLIGAVSVWMTMGAGQARPLLAKKTAVTSHAPVKRASGAGSRWKQGFTHSARWQTSRGGNYSQTGTVKPTGKGAYSRSGTFSNTFPNGRTDSGVLQGTGQVTHTANSVTNDYSGTRTYKDGQTVDVNRDSTVTKTGNGFDKSTTTTVSNPDGHPITTVNSATTHVNGQGNATQATVTGPLDHTATVDSSSQKTGNSTFEQQATVRDANGQVIGGDQATGTVHTQNGSLVQTVQGTTDNGSHFKGQSTTTLGPSGATTNSSGRVTGPAGHTTTATGTSTTAPNQQSLQSLNLSGQQWHQIVQVWRSTADPTQRQARIQAILTPQQQARWQHWRQQHQQQ